MKNNTLFVFGFLILFQTGFSQIIDFKKDNYWMDAGLGLYSSTGESFGVSSNLGVNLISDSTFYKIRFLNQQEFVLFSGPNVVEEFSSVGMMIGKGFSGKYIQIQFLVGLGITGGIKRGELLYTNSGGYAWFSLTDERVFEKERFISPSIPVEIDLLIKPIKYLGVGTSLFGDLNLKRPMYGLVFKFGLGKLR